MNRNQSFVIRNTFLFVQQVLLSALTPRPNASLCDVLTALFWFVLFFSPRDVGLFLLAVQHVLLCYVLYISLPFSFSPSLARSLAYSKVVSAFMNFRARVSFIVVVIIDIDCVCGSLVLCG